MKLIKSNVEIWTQESGIEGVYKQIEKVGKVCYKSEATINEGSAKPFVERLGNAGHGKALEQGTVYLKFPNEAYYTQGEHKIALYYFYRNNPYSKIMKDKDEFYVTTNYRVLYENNHLSDLQYLCEPTKFHEKRVCIHFICDRGVSAEANRHTVNSAMEQSTRYCNYSRDKFGNEIKVIVPGDIDIQKGNFSDIESQTVALRRMCGAIYGTNAIDGENARAALDIWNEVDYWMFGNLASEFAYMGLIKCGWKPQQARRVLPLDLQTELCHTAFISDWKHFIDLRSAPDAHPDIRILSDKIKNLLGI